MNELTTTEQNLVPGFGSAQSWDLAQRIGKAFAASTLVPAQYQGNLANCIVALEMAHRMGVSPLMVMQNLYIVHGNPGWSAKFLIACFNQCGRFSSMRYEWSADRSACRAWAMEKATGERIEGPQVSIEMARAEGWSTKNGSKWKTMPELMLMYRAAAFLIRTYAPEISMGLATSDELEDIHGSATNAAKRATGSVMLSDLIPDTPALSNAPDVELDQATGEIVDEQKRPTYAELADRITKAKTPEEARAVLDEMNHLPLDQQADLSKLAP